MGIIHGNQWINEDIIGQITEIIKYNKTTKHQFIDKYINYYFIRYLHYWTMVDINT